MKTKTRYILPAIAVGLVAICWLLLISMIPRPTADLQYVPNPQPAPVIPIVVP